MDLKKFTINLISTFLHIPISIDTTVPLIKKKLSTPKQLMRLHCLSVTPTNFESSAGMHTHITSLRMRDNPRAVTRHLLSAAVISRALSRHMIRARNEFTWYPFDGHTFTRGYNDICAHASIAWLMPARGAMNRRAPPTLHNVFRACRYIICVLLFFAPLVLFLHGRAALTASEVFFRTVSVGGSIARHARISAYFEIAGVWSGFCFVFHGGDF